MTEPQAFQSAEHRLSAGALIGTVVPSTLTAPSSALSIVATQQANGARWLAC